MATGYTGTVHFSDSAGSATLPANYTFTTASKGVHTFIGVILRNKVSRTLKVVDTLHSSIFGTWTVMPA